MCGVWDIVLARLLTLRVRYSHRGASPTRLRFSHRLTLHGCMQSQGLYLLFASLAGCSVVAAVVALSEASTAAARAVLAALLLALLCCFGVARAGDGDLDARARGVTSTILAGDVDRERTIAVAPVLRCGDVCFGGTTLLALLVVVASPSVALALPPILRGAWGLRSRCAVPRLESEVAPPPMRHGAALGSWSGLCITAAGQNPIHGRRRLYDRPCLCGRPCLSRLCLLSCPAFASCRRSSSILGLPSRHPSWSKRCPLV